MGCHVPECLEWCWGLQPRTSPCAAASLPNAASEWQSWDLAVPPAGGGEPRDHRALRSSQHCSMEHQWVVGGPQVPVGWAVGVSAVPRADAALEGREQCCIEPQ